MRISDWSSDVCSSDLAIGSDSVASEADTVSFGHLATDEDEFTGGTYGSDLQRRLVNVADGIGDHDAATMGQLGSVVAALGGGASFSGGVFSAPSYVIQGSSYDNVGAAFAAVDGRLDSLQDSIDAIPARSEERCGGKEGVNKCRSRVAMYPYKKKHNKN